MINIGIVGFGTVGTGVVKILTRNKEMLQKKIGAEIDIKKIVDKDIESPREIEVPSALLTTDIGEVLNNQEINLVVELIGGYEPARSIVLTAIRKGKHVVTANKAMLAKYWRDILLTAQASKVEVQFEASVGGGIPIIQSIISGLSGNRILSIFGIINGTCNYILTKMSEENREFKEVLDEAKKNGYAEKDPTFDIEGIDTAHKISILSSLAFNSHIKVEDIYREGIIQITPQDISYAKEEFGYVIKLLGIAKTVNGRKDVRVHPTMIPETHLLASVGGVYNAIYVIGDSVGPLLFYGQGAGEMAAGSAVVSDIVRVARKIVDGSAGLNPTFLYPEEEVELKSIDEVNSKYYIRFSALDQPGVLAAISGILGKRDISIASVIQKGRREGDIVPIVMLTHEACEKNMRRALQEIDALPVVKAKSVVIRVEELA
jgi:homoserine dehydrogenase